MASELEDALVLANLVMDQGLGSDPDSDMTMLARQLIRQCEARDAYKRILTKYLAWVVAQTGSAHLDNWLIKTRSGLTPDELQILTNIEAERGAQ
jgi:hypothetical protein